MFIVFDLDGTLANLDHRRHFVEGDDKNWDEFYRHCGKDKPIMPVIKLAQELKVDNRVQIWSGRSMSTWNTTKLWLEQFQLGSQLTLMRPEGDFTPDHELKKAWIMHAKSSVGGAPDMVFDDRDKVVQMWRDNGIVCSQVAEGDF